MNLTPASQPIAMTPASVKLMSSRQSGRSRRRRRRVWLWWAMTAHVAVMAILWLLIFVVSEQHWLGSAVTFLPRWPWLIPGVVLCLVSAKAWSRSFWLNAATLLFSLVTIGGFNVPTARLFGSDVTISKSDAMASATNDAPSRIVRVLSCNVQSFEPDFGLLLREIAHAQPDVMVFQEAYRPPRILHEHFPDWQYVHTEAYWIGSRWPVTLVGRCDSEAFQREIGLAAEIDSPAGKFVVVDLHLMTARKSLMRLKSKGVLTGASQERVNSALVDRQLEANDALAFVTKHGRKKPVVICGDFNMPTSSSILQSSFSSFTNAFEATSWGFGHTAPCRKISFWPSNMPWQRIDHIMTNSAWQVIDSHIGRFDGSDHRLISTTLHLRLDAAEELNSEAPNIPDLTDEVQSLLK